MHTLEPVFMHVSKGEQRKVAGAFQVVPRDFWGYPEILRAILAVPTDFKGTWCSQGRFKEFWGELGYEAPGGLKSASGGYRVVLGDFKKASGMLFRGSMDVPENLRGISGSFGSNKSSRGHFKRVTWGFRGY